MTHHDTQLIEKANAMNRWQYREIDNLIPQAQSEEARETLVCIRWNIYDLVCETI